MDIDAASESDARAQVEPMMLISSVIPVAVGQSQAVRHATAMPDEPPAPPPPQYQGLRIAADFAMVYAVVLYLVTFVLAALAVQTWNDREGLRGVLAFTPAIGTCLGAVLMHAVSSACLALRDIARNSHRI